MSSIPFTILYALAVLAAVLALIWLAARAARLSGLAPRAGTGRRLGLVETLAIDQRRRLYLVRCDGRELLVLAGGGSEVPLGWLDAPERQP
jgi:flagellar protein FliO/FliZ